MTPAKLSQLLKTVIQNRLQILIKSQPGCGKSDIVAQVSSECGVHLVIMHPAVSDPTDFKGMPAMVNGAALFVPFGDLDKLIQAKTRTVCFLDDIGQAAPSVQAALMQLVLARQVNGTRISEEVCFVGATNDTTHMAGVSGMIEPLKSRWHSIVTLDPDSDAWSTWGLDNGMPSWEIAFIRSRPQLLSDFKPTKELRNSPSPRGWAAVGTWYNLGVQDLDVWTGAVGEGAAVEAIGFLEMQGSLPSLDAIILDPDGSPIPEKSGGKFCVSAGLARKASALNFGRIMQYAERLPIEFQTTLIKDAIRLNKALTQTQPFIVWATKNSKFLI